MLAIAVFLIQPPDDMMRLRIELWRRSVQMEPHERAARKRIAAEQKSRECYAYASRAADALAQIKAAGPHKTSAMKPDVIDAVKAWLRCEGK